MHMAIARLKSISPYSQSRYYEVEKLDKELFGDYERRTWQNRMHVGEDGRVFIPPMCLKNCLSSIAKFLGEKIKGQRNRTYTKHFEAGVLVVDAVVLPIKVKDVPGEWLFVPSDGIRGSGKRVMKCFPLITSWAGEATFHILDDTITEDVFRRHLEQAGSFIGIGRFRPQNNGFYGRFAVESLEWA